MKQQENNGLDERIRELAILQQKIRQCRLCQEHGYLGEAQPLVSGRASDRILVIGQAPGQRSIERGLPFSGPGGKILQKWLEQAGFPPGYLHEHAYLSSLTRCDPGKNARGNGDRRPSPPELALCRPYLEAELRIVEPQVVLLVGIMAIEEFLGKSALQKVVGTYQERGKQLFLPLPHPSGVSRWLNDPEHQELLRQALSILEEWRGRYSL